MDELAYKLSCEVERLYFLGITYHEAIKQVTENFKLENLYLS